MVLLGVAAACDGFGDSRMQRLEEEVRALRAAQAGAPADVTDAMAPLRSAVEVLVQRGEVERTRWTALAAEIDQLATLVQGVVEAGRRGEVDALRQRIGELERQAAERAKAQDEDRDLLLRALEATANKLEAFLQQARVRKGAALPEGAVPEGGRGSTLWRSVRDPRVLWPLGLAVVGVVGLLAWSRRRRRPSVLPLDAPDAFVDAPPPPSSKEAGLDGRDGYLTDSMASLCGPLSLLVEVRTANGEAASQRLSNWLAQDPRVLARPVPTFEVRPGVLHARFYVAAGMSLAERNSLAAEVRARGCGESHADRRSA
ncbi:MAG: hypothetical protein R3F56_25880 [Planctomycetota bacterium]